MLYGFLAGAIFVNIPWPDSLYHFVVAVLGLGLVVALLSYGRQ